MTPDDFAKQFMPYAQQVSQRTGLDPRLVLAQAALETGYGRSAPNNNFFGIKSHGKSGGSNLMTKEFEGGRMVSKPQSFRGYADPSGSFQDYADFILRNPRYKTVLAEGDLGGQIAAMGRSGYATDPEYAQKLRSIANRFGADLSDQQAATPSRSFQATNTQGAVPMMQQEEKPRGLLGSLGIQKMEEGAAGETGQRFYRRDSFKDTAAILAQGFGRMGIMGMEEIADDIAKQRTEKKARNKTMEAIGKMGTPQSQVALEYIKAGGDPVSALKIAFAKPDAVRGVTMGDRLINPETGEVMADFSEGQGDYLTKDQMASLNTLRDDLRTELKPFEIVKSGYKNITTFYNNPGATSDYALAVAFAKILDPGSVAREGEVAAVQNAGARIPALGQALKNAITSEGSLTPEVRQEIAELATKIYSEREAEARSAIAGYTDLAARANVPSEFLYSGSIPEVMKIVPATVPAAALAAGVTQEMWSASSDEDKEPFLR